MWLRGVRRSFWAHRMAPRAGRQVSVCQPQCGLMLLAALATGTSIRLPQGVEASRASQTPEGG